MNGRRRNPRYYVSTPFEGVLQTLTGATIESCDGACVLASSDVPLRSGLSLVLDVFAGSTRRTLPVTVVESVPMIRSGLVRYRLRLVTAASNVVAAGGSTSVRGTPRIMGARRGVLEQSVSSVLSVGPRLW